MAYEIIKQLEAKGLSKKLRQLKEGLTERDVRKGQKHKVVEESLMQSRFTTEVLLQKINYFHLNCVRGKWKLAANWFR
jgi:hypothetical protein